MSEYVEASLVLESYGCLFSNNTFMQTIIMFTLDIALYFKILSASIVLKLSKYKHACEINVIICDEIYNFTKFQALSQHLH